MSDVTFRRGMRVTHPDFGDGTVTNPCARNGWVLVDFDSGTMDAKCAPVKLTPLLGRGAWVGYQVDRTGYTVRVYDADSNEVAEYSAGNHPGDSQVYLPADSKGRVPLPTLRKFARQTAEDMAGEYGINLAMVQQEESGE